MANRGRQAEPLRAPERHGHPSVAYRHGLRASELVALRWDDVEV
jgi:integrase